MAIIEKIYMRSQIGFDWPRGRVMLACVCGGDHFGNRFGGPRPYSSPPSWPGHGGYSPFKAPPMDPLALPHLMPLKKLEKAPFILIPNASPTEDPYWREIFKGAQTCTKKRDIELKLFAPKIAGDIEAQIGLFNKAIGERPIAFALWVSDPKRWLPILQKADKENIPYILFATKTPRLDGVPRIEYPVIGIDDYRIGQLMAIRALKTERITKKTLVVGASSESSLYQRLRYEGIESILTPQKIKSEFITVNSANPSTGAVVLQTLKLQPDISSIFFLNGEVFSMCKSFVSDYMRETKNTVYLATFDKPAGDLEHIKSGFLGFYIDCRPFLQGYLAMMSPFKNYRIRPQIIAGKDSSSTAFKAA